jgi:hypothetical protein
MKLKVIFQIIVYYFCKTDSGVEHQDEGTSDEENWMFG